MARTALSGYAKGWFVVAFSGEIPKGVAKPLHYFGQELVAYRGDDDKVRILDAYCPHLGAHLGYGGKVEGGCVRCPFHAWRFDEEGRCNEIPYAKKIPPGAKIKPWSVVEKNGVVLVYFDPAGQAPEFEIPVIAEYGTDEWLPWVTTLYHVKTHPREIVDNLADRAHFAVIHDTIVDDFRFEVDGHCATQHLKGRASLPGGGVDNFASTTTYHGPAYLLMRMDGALQNYMLVAHTPIDENTLDLRLGVALKIVGSRSKTEGFVKVYMDNLKHGFEDDLRVWETKVYRDQPVLCEGDGPLVRLRKWYRQFYPASAAEVDASAGA